MKKVQKYLLFFFVAIASLGLAYAVFFPVNHFEKDKAKEEFRRGLLLYNDYRYAASTDFFVQSLSYNPEFLLARRMLGQALYFSGQKEEALNEWQSIFDMGGYDPMLQVHMQNLRSSVEQQNSELSTLMFSRILSPQPGYRYSFPTFLGKLQDDSLFLVTTGSKEGGSILFMNNNSENSKIYRRVSGKLQTPVAAAASKNEVWITDYASDSIHRLKLPTLPFLTSLQNPKAVGGKGSQPLQFFGPAGICHLHNAFYVVDSGNGRIQKISESGEFMFEFSQVKGDYSLQNPFGIACFSQGDRKGEIYVSESEQGRISVFDEDGNFSHYLDIVLKKPRHLSLYEEKNILVIADEQEGVILYNLEERTYQKINGYESENTLNSFSRPYSATFDMFENLYTVDYGAHHVVQFSPMKNLYSNLNVWVEKIDVSSFPTVALWVSVYDAQNRAVLNLNEDNFLLSENDAMLGKPSVNYLKQFENQASSVIVLSRSQQMKQYQETMPWLFDFIYGGIRQKDVMKLVSYNESYREDSPWTNSRLRLQQAYQRTQDSDYETQNAQSSDALYYAVSELLPAKGTRSILWITDGEVNEESFSSISLRRIQQFAKVNHVAVYVLSYENPDYPLFERNKTLLENFAEGTGGKYFSIYHDNLQELDSLIRQIKKERYVLTYHSGANADWKDQYMDVKVRVNFMNRKGSETGGYFIPQNIQGGFKGLF